MQKERPLLLSIIVPVFNEEATLLSVLDKLLTLPIVAFEVIVVDDGSSDATASLLRGTTDPRVITITHVQNRGKGAAVRSGLGVASGRFVVIQDADLEYSPLDLLTLLAPLESGEADVVYGNRFHPMATARLNLNRVANHFLTWLCNRVCGLRLHDVETCYKMFRRDLEDSFRYELVENRFGIEIELTCRFAAAGARIVEREITYRPRSHAAGKKIGFVDGLSAVRCILTYGLKTWLTDRQQVRLPDQVCSEAAARRADAASISN